MPIQSRVDDYKGYYDNKSFNSIEQVVLAEDVKFKEFVDTPGKFFFKTVTPKVDEFGDMPTIKGQSSNYIELIIPGDMLITAAKPKFLTCGIDPKTGCLKPGLKGYNVLYTKEPADGFYVLPKGTVFLIEMLGGSMRTERGRLIAYVGGTSK